MIYQFYFLDFLYKEPNYRSYLENLTRFNPEAVFNYDYWNKVYSWAPIDIDLKPLINIQAHTLTQQLSCNKYLLNLINNLAPSFRFQEKMLLIRQISNLFHNVPPIL